MLFVQKRDTGISYISSGWNKSNRNWPTKTAEVLLRLQSKEIIVRKQIICFVDACYYFYSCHGNWSLLIALASWSWPLECAGQVVSGQRWDHYMGWRDQQKFVRFVICLLLLLSVLLLLLIVLNWKRWDHYISSNSWCCNLDIGGHKFCIVSKSIKDLLCPTKRCHLADGPPTSLTPEHPCDNDRDTWHCTRPPHTAPPLSISKWPSLWSPSTV